MKRLAPAVVALAVLAACSSGGEDDSQGADDAISTPTFAPLEGDGTGDVTTSSVDGVPTTQSTAAGATATTAAASSPQKVSFEDPVGDATPAIGVQDPPPWTDLAGGSLERQGNAYRLIVRLGGAVPETAPGAETMNIASYFDVDGDGRIDYEIWANLGRNGWGPVWYDDEGHAAPGDRSNVTVAVQGDEVRLLFPDVMLGKPDRLRFSLASEYGPLTAIGSDGARRDDAPDDDAAVSFP